MRVIFEDVAAPDVGSLNLSVQATSDMRITAVRARQLVGIFTGNHISTQIHGITPEELVVREGRAYWRVPVIFSMGLQGQIGKIGTIDVDTQSGDLTICGKPIDKTHTQGMLDNARRLAASHTPHSTN
ncbi:MAG: hypothetical protein HY328_14215 [Chloroflexi bacterium]|nr:hypothetical protein [Chloroflexota bacterium]